MTATGLGAVFALLLAGSGSTQELPRVREIAFEGIEAYDLDEVRDHIRLEEGETMWRPAEEVAAALETRYHDDGFPAASVRASFDVEAGVLTIEVDEGRLASVTVEGLEGKAQRRAIDAAGLRLGSVLEEIDIEDAMAEIEERSDRALTFGTLDDLTPGDYAVERGDDGAELILKPSLHTGSIAAAAAAPGVPGIAGVTNRVDGLNLGFSGDLTLFDKGSYNHTLLYARPRYGLGSERLRYSLGGLRSFGGRTRITLGYEYHDITDHDDEFRVRGLDEGRGSTIRTSPVSDFFRRKGHEAYAFVEIGSHFEVGASYRRDTYGSLEATSQGRLFASDDPTPNPEIDEGVMGSVIVSAAWQARSELFGQPPIRRRQGLLRRSLFGTYWERPSDLRIEATLESAPPDLDGSFDFRRLIGALRGRHSQGNHRIDVRILAGGSDGELPRQKQFAVGGAGTLRGYPFKHFRGERFALGTLEWSIAGRRTPRLIFFYDIGATWSDDGDSGWKSGVGLGVQFPPRDTLHVRFDVGYALNEFAVDGEIAKRELRPILKIRLPF